MLAVFARSELSEPLLLVYRLIREACESECNLIEVSSDAVAFGRSGEHDRIVPRRATGIDERPFFDLVCARDPSIARHVRRVSRAGGRDEYVFDLGSATDGRH